MIEICSNNVTLIDFLSNYPEALRKKCAEAVLNYGLLTIRYKFPYGLSATQLFSISGMPEEDAMSAKNISGISSFYQNKPTDFNKYFSEGSVKSDEKSDVSRDRPPKFPEKQRKIYRTESEKSMKFGRGLKEPMILSLEKAKDLLSKDTENDDMSKEQEVMRIAEDFLKTSYASFSINQPEYKSRKSSYMYMRKNK